MIERIKGFLSRLFEARQIRVGGIAVLTAFTIAAVTLFGASVKTVKVFDGEHTYTVHALDVNVAQLLTGLNLKSDNYKILSTSLQANTTTVEIAYPYPVYITQGDETVTLEFTGGTVQDALTLAGIQADESDFVEPALDTEITDTVYIDYADVEYVTGSYTEEIPYQTKTVYSSASAEGSVTQTAGRNGVQEVTYSEKLVNGVSTGKTVTAVNVVKNAIDSIKTIGTKKVAASTVKTAAAVTTSASVKCWSTLTPPSPIELDANGVPVHYKSKITSRATAYTHTGHNCSTGVYPQPGYIAVNPKVIPYGTRMYIRTADGKFIYGYAVAADTGGFIKKYPTGVDLFMDTYADCTVVGVKYVDIYILD